jgi:hypothetical protein
MLRYKVSVECTDFFEELEIDAQNEWEAEAKYQALLDNGEVQVIESGFADIAVRMV